MTRWASQVCGLVCGLLILAACGGGGGAAPASSPPTSGAFPVTIEHSLGSTTIPAAPKRVVSLGYTDQDAILALGVVPVAIREFTGDRPSATWPWATPALQGQQVQVLKGDQISAETVAALRPDLIVAISAGLTPEQYGVFAKIAPTITQPPGATAFQVKWQDATRMVGKALGEPEKADKLVSDVEARFAAVRARYPQLAGKRAAVAAASSAGNGGYFVWTSGDNRGQFLTDIGMSVPATFDQLAGQRFYADISAERLNLLDENDVLAWLVIPGTSNATLDQQPGASALRLAQQSKVVNLTTEQGVALSFSSVLSLPALLDTLPGEFAARLGA